MLSCTARPGERLTLALVQLDGDTGTAIRRWLIADFRTFGTGGCASRQRSRIGGLSWRQPVTYCAATARGGSSGCGGELDPPAGKRLLACALVDGAVPQPAAGVGGGSLCAATGKLGRRVYRFGDRPPALEATLVLIAC